MYLPSAAAPTGPFGGQPGRRHSVWGDTGGNRPQRGGLTRLQHWEGRLYAVKIKGAQDGALWHPWQHSSRLRVLAVSNNRLGPGLQEGGCPVQKGTVHAIELQLPQQVVVWYRVKCLRKVQNCYINLNFAVPKGQKVLESSSSWVSQENFDLKPWFREFRIPCLSRWSR